MWEIEKQWEDDNYSYIRYKNGTFVQASKSTAQGNQPITINLPPTVEQRLAAVEDTITALLGL